MSEPRVPDLTELVGDVSSAEELAKLERAHELLIAAGPLPELSPPLSAPPVVHTESPVRILPRRRREAALVLAAAALAAVFAVGYLIGGRGDSFSARRVVEMHGVGELVSARASIEIASADEDGNWPFVLTVNGLAELPRGGWYELYLTRKGKLVAPCGSFKTHRGATTTVRMNGGYELRRYDGWAVAAYIPGKKEQSSKILLRTERI
jgi:hypothetical protein